MASEQEPRSDDRAGSWDEVQRLVADVERLIHEPRKRPEAVGGDSPPFLEARAGRYRLVRAIGRGGMGVVYEGHDEQLDRRVAIKILPSGYLSRLRLLREAKALAKVRHPFICDVFEIDVDGPTPFLVMELIEGFSLAQVLTERAASAPSGALVARMKAGANAVPHPSPSRLREQDVVILRFFAKVAAALDAAHEAGVIHRDVKPSNIMVTDDGEPTLIDFGLAFDPKLARDPASSCALAGTPGYIAPELHGGKQSDPPYSRRSDLFSLGLVLFECLTGITPTHSPDRGDDAVPDLRTVAAEAAARRWPQDLRTIFEHMLDADPHRRYERAAEVSLEIDSLLAGEAIRARPMGVLRRVSAAVRRHRSLSAMSVILAVILIGWAWSSDVLRRRAESNERIATDITHLAVSNLNGVALDIVQGLGEVVGSRRLRRRVLESIDHSLHQIESRVDDDRWVIRERLHFDLLRAEIARDLGDADATTERLDDLTRRIDEFYSTNAPTEKSAQDLAVFSLRIAELSISRGRHDEARAALDRGSKCLEAWNGERRTKEIRASIFVQSSREHLLRGAYSRAESEARRAVDELRPLAGRESPSRVEFEIMQAWLQLAAVLAAMDRDVMSADAATEALELAERLMQDDPARRDVRLSRALALEFVATSHAAASRYEQARDLIEKSIEDLAFLERVDSRDIEALQRLVSACNRSSVLSSTLSDAERLVLDLRRQLAACERLFALNPKAETSMTACLSARGLLADALVKIGRHEEAESLASMAIQDVLSLLGASAAAPQRFNELIANVSIHATSRLARGLSIAADSWIAALDAIPAPACRWNARLAAAATMAKTAMDAGKAADALVHMSSCRDLAADPGGAIEPFVVGVLAVASATWRQSGMRTERIDADIVALFDRFLRESRSDLASHDSKSHAEALDQIAVALTHDARFGEAESFSDAALNIMDAVKERSGATQDRIDALMAAMNRVWIVTLRGEGTTIDRWTADVDRRIREMTSDGISIDGGLMEEYRQILEMSRPSTVPSR